MERETVYRAIDTERRHQDMVWPISESGTKEVGSGVALIVRYANKALNDWADKQGDAAALEQIRKVAALCVRVMEQHGVQPRALDLL